MSFFDVTAMLLTLVALFGWLNRRFIGLPHTTALLLLGLGTSLLLADIKRANYLITVWQLKGPPERNELNVLRRRSGPLSADWMSVPCRPPVQSRSVGKKEDEMLGGEQDLEARVRIRAYELWEEAGHPEGRGNEFWHEAWAEVTSGGETKPNSVSEVPNSMSEPPTTPEPTKPSNASA